MMEVELLDGAILAQTDRVSEVKFDFLITVKNVAYEKS